MADPSSSSSSSTETSSKRKQGKGSSKGKQPAKRPRSDREPSNRHPPLEGDRAGFINPQLINTTAGGSIFEPLSSHCNSAPGAWSPPREAAQSQVNLSGPGPVTQGVTTQGLTSTGGQATFTPTAAGLCAPKSQPVGPECLQTMIAQAVAQFMAASRPQHLP